MSQSLAQKLAQNPIFQSLSISDVEHLADLAIPRQYARDEWITTYQTPWPYLFWVERGQIRALKESCNGRSLIVATINAGETFWGTAFFNEDAPMPVSLQASQASRIYLWSRQTMKPILQNNGAMTWELSRSMVARMQHASQMLEEMTFQSITGRLARLLLNRYGENTTGAVSRDLTLDEMAAHIGSTREMVCRALYRFADDGVLKITRTEFFFTNPKQLQEMAQREKRNDL